MSGSQLPFIQQAMRVSALKTSILWKSFLKVVLWYFMFLMKLLRGNFPRIDAILKLYVHVCVYECILQKVLCMLVGIANVHVYTPHCDS